MSARGGLDAWRHFEPSISIVVGSYTGAPESVERDLPSHAGHFLNRLALGVLARNHGDSAWSSIDVRVGATICFANLELGRGRDDLVTAGGEVEVNVPVSDSVRVGPRIGVERGADGVWLFSGGVRLHANRAFFVTLEVLHATPPDESFLCFGGRAPCKTSTTLFTIGLGLEGRAGTYVGLVNAGLLAIGFAAKEFESQDAP
jgi:hypothetical protein